MSTPNRAWTYSATGYPSCLHLTTTSTPPTTTPPTPKTLILRIHAAALNPVDIQLMNLPLWSLPLPLPPLSTVRAGLMGAGADFSGTVLAAGADTRFKPGDEVFGLGMPPMGGSGTLRDVATVDLAGAAVALKPAAWSWAKAAGVALVWLTARTAVESVKGAVEKGAEGGKVVVLGGSSATGMYTVWLARRRGWTVLSTCSGRNAEFVRGMGAHVVVDYTVESVPGRVRKFAPDAIVDCVGGTECLGLAGRYVTIVGDKTSRASMGGRLTFLWNPRMLVRWALGAVGWGVWYDCVNLEMRSDWLEEAARELPVGKIEIDGEFPFEQAREAYERLNTGRARGKVVVRVAE